MEKCKKHKDQIDMCVEMIDTCILVVCIDILLIECYRSDMRMNYQVVRYKYFSGQDK